MTSDRAPAEGGRATSPGRRHEDGSGNAGAERTWPATVAAVVISAAGAAVIWFLAVPRHDVCPAVYPAPPGCMTAERVGPGLVASGGIAVALVVAIVLLRTVARGRPGRSAAVLAVLGLLVIALANVVWLA